ncbi:MAG TPA: LCCL domain-containing protein [Pyrinomonadaceae bacterium]|nr:LCCL domain-containing protein [Pyrinomonadaceae bacterium]
MKTCPKCGTTTADDAQSYCLMDGTALVDQTVSEPTVVMDRSRPTVTTQQPRKRKALLWIVLALTGIAVIGGLVGVLMYAAYRMGSESASIKVNANSGQTPASKSKSNPQPTPSAPVSTQGTPSGESIPSADAPTPISWTASAGFVKQETGLQYTFECPPDGTSGTVWGSDVYTADSSICTAAVHAGKITLEKGGIVTIEFTGGRQTYGATTRNGVTTYNYGQYPHSFVFKDAERKEQ